MAASFLDDRTLPSRALVAPLPPGDTKSLLFSEIDAFDEGSAFPAMTFAEKAFIVPGRWMFGPLDWPSNSKCILIARHSSGSYIQPHLYRRTLMFALFLVANLSFPAQSVDTVAMVLVTKGKVTFERDKEASCRLGAMALVRPGDRILVPDGGEVILVFLHDGHRERLKPASRTTVETKGCQPGSAVEQMGGRKLSAANLERLRRIPKFSPGFDCLNLNRHNAS